MGDISLHEAFAAAHRLQIPAYTFPEDAVRAFGALWQRRQVEVRSVAAGGAAQQEALALTDAARAAAARGRRKAQDILMLAHAAGKRALDPVESRNLLEAYGIRTPQEYLSVDPDDAVAFADRIGYPVVLKIISPDILHKSDIGGVIVGVENEQGVRDGFDQILERAHATHPDAHIRGIQVQEMVQGGQQVIIGIKRDPTFGPLVMFGLGGVYVEALADVSFRLAPLTRAGRGGDD